MYAFFEPNGFAGIGGVCFNSQSAVLGFVSEEIPTELLKSIKSEDKETVTMELEMMAISAAALENLDHVTPCCSQTMSLSGPAFRKGAPQTT